MESDVYTITSSDFYEGHDTDPTAVPRGFSAWREATARPRSLYGRCLTQPVAARTTISAGGQHYEVLNLASLDYLGLCARPEVVAASKAALDEWGAGACGVPLLSGMTTLHLQLEARVAELLQCQAAVAFTSGFSGAIGLTSGLLRRGDVAILDEKAHMSMMDGVKLAGARVAMFRHNDPASLDELLTRHAGRRRLVVVDGLYSMDGDLADLPSLLDVADAHGVGLVVDEAHSTFCMGAGGGGVTEHFGVQDRVRVFFGTFSKALSHVGGFLAADEELIDYLRLFAHPYVFSAALPPSVVAGILAAIEICASEPELRQRLADNARYFRAGLRTLGLDCGVSESHIVPIIVGDRRDLLYDGGLELMARGLYLPPVDYPAVPEDGLRFRAAITAGHTLADLDDALQILEDVLVSRMRRTA